MEVWGSAGFVFVAILLWPLSGVEFILLTLAYFLILITELINTAVEQMLERLHPQRHELIGKSKDVASAAVLMAFVFAVIVVAVLVQTRFF
jgi:diacylglycerol kinase